MKSTILLLFGTLPFLLGCASLRNNTYKYSADTVVEMSKGPCFGTCPVYDFRIDGTGQATLKGKQHMKYTGEFVQQFTPQQTNELIRQFVKADFFEFEDEYLGNITDQPTVWLTLTHKGESKKIRCHYEVPQTLLDLIGATTVLSEGEGWQSTITE